MTDYRRFISYLYQYEKGEKGENVGFSKVESRNGTCRIAISLRGVYIGKNEQCKIYGLVQKKKSLYGIYLGMCPTQNGMVDYKISTQTENIGGSKYSLEDLCGVLVDPEREKIFATGWDKKPINVRLFSLVDEEITEKAEAYEYVQAAEVKYEDEEKEMVEEKSEETVHLTMQSRIAHHSRQNIEEVKNSIRHNQEKVIHYKEPQEKWNSLVAAYKRIEPFEDGYFAECIEIQPKDLVHLQREEWILGNNSFLLHGYYNYRYLILGRLEKDNHSLFVLGVPGIYDNQEKLMANMFGFPKFKSAKNVLATSGEFGYWYRTVR